MTKAMSAVLDEFTAKAKEGKVYTSNALGGMMGILFCQKDGYTIHKVTRSSGRFDLSAMDEMNNREVCPFWVDFYRTYMAAEQATNASTAREITSSLAASVISKLVTDYKLSMEESALVMAFDKALFYAEWNCLNGEPENYRENLIELVKASEEVINLGLVDKLKTAFDNDN